MTFKKYYVALSLLLILVLCVACGKDGDDVSENNNQNHDDNQNNEQVSDDGTEEEPFELSIMLNLHTPEVPDERLQGLLEEETNTKLDIQWIPDNNYEERVNAAFSTNSLPQAFLVKASEFVQFKDAVRDGQFWEIGPYLDEYENLSKLRQDVLDNQKVDDKLYSLYMGRPLSRNGIIYRKDWADNLDISTPTTTDEFYDMLRAFTEDDPNDNGEDDTIGLADRGDLGTFSTIATWLGTPNEWGVKDGEILPEFMFPEYKEALNYFKDIHSNGYMNQDAPVASKTDQQDMLKDGTAGAYIGSMQDVRSIYEDAKDINPDVEFDVHNYVEGADGEYRTRSIPGYGSLIMFPKDSTTEEELKQILSFFDYLMTPEGANLLIWGVEDEHYEVIDGKAAYITDNQAAIDREITPYTPFEIGEPETNGRYEGYYEYEPAEKALELYKDNDNYLIDDATIGLDSETYIKQSEMLQQIIDDATYNYILGEIDEDGFDDAIEDWKSQGGNQVIEEFNADQ